VDQANAPKGWGGDVKCVDDYGGGFCVWWTQDVCGSGSSMCCRDTQKISQLYTQHDILSDIHPERPYIRLSFSYIRSLVICITFLPLLLVAVDHVRIM
jgi:hypothetical protein